MKNTKCFDKTPGIAFLGLTAVLWSVQGVFGKLNDWNSFALVGIRGIVSAFVLGLCRKSFKIPKGFNNFLAAISVAATAVLFIFANRLTTAANAIALQYIMPIFVIAYSCIWENKSPKKTDIVAALFMFSGLCFCCIGDIGSGNVYGSLLAVASAITMSVVFIAGGNADCDTLGYTYLGSLFCALITPFGFLVGLPKFNLSNILSAVLMGVCVGLGYYCFSLGFAKKVHPVKAAVISYIEPVLNPLIVFLVLGEAPKILGFVGIIIVLVTALIYAVKTAYEKTT